MIVIHFVQQFRLALPISRISRFWIWPTITSKSFQFQFRQCQNFVFWTCQSIVSVRCLADLAPSQCSKYSICHTTIWTKTHCPETSSWWVIDLKFLFTTFFVNHLVLFNFHLQKLFVLCTWGTMNLNTSHLALATWRICKLWVEERKITNSNFNFSTKSLKIEKLIYTIEEKELLKIVHQNSFFSFII